MSSDDILLRAQVGVRTLLARGLVLRAISWLSSVLLIALVRPEDYGLLAVVRGALGLIGFASELGFVDAMVRGKTPPTRPEMAALAGLRLVVFLGVFLLVAFSPAALPAFGLAVSEWHGWLVALVGSLLVTPWQLGSRIRLERDLEFGKLAAFEVSMLVFQNVGLVIAAIAGEFGAGIFVVMMVSSVLGTIVLTRLAPGSGLSFDLRPLKRISREVAGFSISSLFVVLRDSFVPLLVASLFGLASAGIWALALRIGQLHHLVFDAYWRSGFPAASRVATDPAALGRLSLGALRQASRLSYPLAASLFAVVPVIAVIVPVWAPSVIQTQIYVLSLGLAGVYSAALAPVAVAIRGARAAALEHGLSTGAILLVLLALKLAATPTIALAYAAGNAVSMLSLVAMTPSGVRPPLLATVLRPLLSLAAVVGGYLALRAIGVGLVITATTACAAAIVLGWPERHHLAAVFLVGRRADESGR